MLTHAGPRKIRSNIILTARNNATFGGAEWIVGCVGRDRSLMLRGTADPSQTQQALAPNLFGSPIYEQRMYRNPVPDSAETLLL